MEFWRDVLVEDMLVSFWVVEDFEVVVFDVNKEENFEFIIRFEGSFGNKSVNYLFVVFGVVFVSV